MVAAVAGLATLGAVFYFTWQSIGTVPNSGQWSYTELKVNADQGTVRELDITGMRGVAITRDSRRYDVQLPDQTAQLATQLAAENPPVNVVYEPTPAGGYWLQVLVPNLILLFLLLVPAAFLAVYLIRRRRR